MNAAYIRAQSYVGRQLRILDDDAWNYGRWGQIVMVVPSRGHACWLVDYPDGCTDVVPATPSPELYAIR
jgi:hypothetical protein